MYGWRYISWGRKGERGNERREKTKGPNKLKKVFCMSSLPLGTQEAGKTLKRSKMEGRDRYVVRRLRIRKETREKKEKGNRDWSEREKA